MRIRNVKNKVEIMRDSSYFISNPKDYRGHFQDLFPRCQPLYVELGMGKGKFLLENAKAHPSINFVGVEKQDSVVALALKKLETEHLDNLFIICLDARNIADVFSHEVDRIYLNFSDPWPKSRHHARRLTSKIFLDQYDAIFRRDALLYLRTDNDGLFTYSLESLSQNGYVFDTVTLNLHKTEGLITTEYEDKFSSQGVSIKGLIAKKASQYTSND